MKLVTAYVMLSLNAFFAAINFGSFDKTGSSFSLAVAILNTIATLYTAYLIVFHIPPRNE